MRGVGLRRLRLALAFAEEEDDLEARVAVVDLSASERVRERLLLDERLERRVCLGEVDEFRRFR